MADASSPAVLATLVPVVIGGVIALAGTWLGPWISERHKEQREKKEHRAEKFEELVATLFEYEHWLNVIPDMNLWANDRTLVPTPPASPFAKLHAISAVHFPQVEKSILELEAAGNSYEVWIVSARVKKVDGDQTFGSGFEDAYGAYAKVRKEVLADLRSYAEREFQ